MPNGLRRPSPTSLRVVQHCLDLFGGQELGALSVGEGRVAGPVDEGVFFDALVELDGWEKGTASVAESVERAQKTVRGRILVDYHFVRDSRLWLASWRVRRWIATCVGR
jgi:hypothetical protein